MNKKILYICFLIILPISFGSSENKGCNTEYKKSEYIQKDKTTQQSDKSADAETSVNSEK